MYPLSFEFNEKLLLDLAYHHLTSLFGTFLCDSFLVLFFIYLLFLGNSKTKDYGINCIYLVLDYEVKR